MCWEEGEPQLSQAFLNRRVFLRMEQVLKKSLSDYTLLTTQEQPLGGMNRPAWKLNEVVRNFVLDYLFGGLC